MQYWTFASEKKQEWYTELKLNLLFKKDIDSIPTCSQQFDFNLQEYSTLQIQ